MRVLLITPRYPTPARPHVGTFIRTRVDSLRAAGVDVEVLAVDALPGRKYLAAIRVLRRRVSEGDIDLVFATYGYSAVVARCQFRVPVVANFIGSDLNGSFDLDGRPTVAGRLEALLSKTVSLLVRSVVVETTAMRPKVPRRRRVYVLPHATDVELFAPVDRAEARRRLELDAGLPLALFAASPDVKVKNFPLAEAASKILRERGLAHELLVVFSEPQERLVLYLGACDALVFPSFAEGSPNIVRQALACNLPIVSTDVGDVGEYVAGVSDCVVCERTPAAFADALEPLLREPRRSNGREAASERLDPRPITATLLEILAEAVGRPGQTPRG